MSPQLDPDQALLARKSYGAESVFRPENLLREARRQKGLADVPVPKVCLLDPDGDVVEHLARTGTGQLLPEWACYHTRMWTTTTDGVTLGVVGNAVGAPFAVLVAEQLAASGADLVISITSAGQLVDLADPPYFVLIDRALRDEGTSVHYQPPQTWSRLDAQLDAAVRHVRTADGATLLRGPSWTTDAPYRETEDAIATARAAGAVCVEMEAAALYAYGAARGRQVVCLAHVTNVMAVAGEDFDKGHQNGATASLALAAAVARAVTAPTGQPGASPDGAAAPR